MENVLSWSRVIISLVFLIYASWSDYRSREVSNTLWIFYAPIGFLLTFSQFLFFPPLLGTYQSMLYYAASFVIVSVFSVALFYAGAFGGADAKALMCLSLALPLPLNIIEPLSGFVSFIFPITIFSNGVILAALSVFYSLMRNFLWRLQHSKSLFAGYERVSFKRKVLILLCGYKVAISKLRASFLYPLEDFSTTENGDPERKLLLFPKDEDREAIVDRLIEARNNGKIDDMVWATPGLPMLIFITIGLMLALTIGDIVWIVLSIIL